MPTRDPEKIRANSRRAYLKHQEARKAKQRAYYAQHRSERAAYNKAYRTAHLEELAAYSKAYARSDAPPAVRARQKAAEYTRIWRSRNAERAREQSRLRQAGRRARGAHEAIASITTLIDRSDSLCEICGGPLFAVEIDHRIPLSRGGRHTVENLRALHRWCNRAKASRLDDEIPPHIVMRCVQKTISYGGTLLIPPPPG